MKLLSFRVSKFRNIVDSGEVKVDSKVSCLVGKNEAGKSGLIEALYLFNPAYGEKFQVDEQYPRWLLVQDRKLGDLKKQTPIAATFAIDSADRDAVNEQLGPGVLDGDKISVRRRYGGGSVWDITWSEQRAISALVKSLPSPLLESFAKADTLEAVKDVLGGMQKAKSASAQDLALVSAAIKARGLDEETVLSRIVKILEDRLPTFFRFAAYSTLPGRIDFREIATGKEDGPGRTSLQTARALLRLAGTDTGQLANENYELRKGELEAVQIDLTRQVFEYWKQNPNLEVSIDVDKQTVPATNGTSAVARFLDIRLRDKRTGYSNNFSQRSSGFQWFFSFLAAFSEFEGKESPIVLLDEPALTLHGRAQADFLRFINERLAVASQVLYTTHSPFMVEQGRLDRVRIVEDRGPPIGAVACDEVLATDPDSLFPLQAALGYDIAQSLFVGPNNLVVEGTSDFIYLTVMSRLCVASGRKGLDERWRILPAGGATNIPTFVSLIGPHLDITVLADSDTKGMQRVTNMIERKLLDGQRLIMAGVALGGLDADLEDLFTDGDYLKLFNKTFAKAIKVGDLPKGGRIVKRIEAHTKAPFIHGEVAETLLRNVEEMTFTDTTLDRFEVIINAINDTISTL
jgi:predicted ATPase